MIREVIMTAGIARLMHLAAKLQLADLLAAGSLTSGDLAVRLEAHPPTLHRLLRGWVACGILVEQEDGTFALSAEGRQLRRDVVDSQWYTVMEWGDVVDKAMVGLEDTVHTGETPFDRVFGMSVWAYRERNPTIGAIFHANVAAATGRIAKALMMAADFSDSRCVVDVGGGQGALIGAILQQSPHIQGMLLDKYPQGAADLLGPLGVIDRCKLVQGDFFTEVPQGGDSYLLKAILHDWNDDESRRILQNCRKAMGPRSRLLLLERSLPERAEAGNETIFSDILMLVLEHGRERSERELRALLHEAGFPIVRRLAIDIEEACLLEAQAGVCV